MLLCAVAPDEATHCAVKVASAIMLDQLDFMNAPLAQVLGQTNFNDLQKSEK